MNRNASPPKTRTVLAALSLPTTRDHMNGRHTALFFFLLPQNWANGRDAAIRGNKALVTTNLDISPCS